MVVRTVVADDVIGSGIAKYIHDVNWWSQASGQPWEHVTVVWNGPPTHSFNSVEIEFPDTGAASAFEQKMSEFGVRVQDA